MGNGEFLRGTTITFAARFINLVVGVGTSIILARVLGPEGKGIYSLAMLLPSLIVTFGNLGIGSATVYYVARREYRWEEILGSNVFLSIIIGGFNVLAGLVLVIFFSEAIFPGVAREFLLLAILLIPVNVFFSCVRYVLLGAQRIKEFNYVQIVQSALFLGLVAFALLCLKAEVTGAIMASLITWLGIDALVFHLAKGALGGFVLRPNISYMKRAMTYGIQAHLSNILGFLNYRIDIFLVNGFLGPAAVGLYSVGVGLAEKLWMVSHAAGTVLFPRVAGEANEEKRKSFTPLVARTVLWLSAFGALVIFFLSRWIILLYSQAFLSSASALQALLVGIVALSAWRVLANDIAGRGHPSLNIYTGVAALIINIFLNLLWIPRYGIVGAAWASTASYTVSFLGTLFFYCRLSGNHWAKVLLPQRGDWALYRNVGKFSWSRLVAVRQKSKGEIV